MIRTSSDSGQYRKMTETPVQRLVLELGFPTTISMLVTNIYNMADTYFVGKLGTSASGAVGIVFGLMAIIQAFGFMFGHGAGSIVSRKLGARDNEGASRFAVTGFVWALISGAAVSVVGFSALNPLMRLLGSTETILPYARTYASFILATAPLMAGSFALNNILRYKGKASFAMAGLVTGALLNIFGDFLFMEIFHMGIAGAGLSTALSQTVSFILLLGASLRDKTQCKLSLKSFSWEWSDLRLIIATGFPSMMRQGLSSVSTMILNGCAGIYGDAAVAAMAIVNRICFFVFAVGLGIGQGFQPVCAFNYGAGIFSRVKKAYVFTLLMGEFALAFLAVVGLIISPHLVGLFRDDPLVIDIGSFALRVQLCSLFFHPLCVCTNMMLQSVGKNKAAIFLSALRSGLVFIPIVLIFTRLFGLTGVETAQTAADILSFFITIPFALSFIRNLPADTAENSPGRKTYD